MTAEPHRSPEGKPLGARLGWRLGRTRYLYTSPWFDLRQDELRLPNGEPATFTYVEHPGFVSIVPLTEEGQILLIRSYRYTVDAWCWEVPAGGVGNKPELDLAGVARSELLEETGCVVTGRLEHVTRYHNAIGGSRTPADIFFATGVRRAAEQRLDATEQIEVHPRPAHEVLAMARGGEIEDGASAYALLLCAERVEAALRGAL